MNLRTTYAASIKKWPRLFDLSKLISRQFEKPDVLYQILSAYEKGREKIVFLQIGSNDGISNDPLREFIVRGNRWEGCLVEPLPYTFQRLKNNYRYAERSSLRMRNAAVSDQSSQLKIYRVKNEFHHEMPGYPDQVASFDPAHVIKHFPVHLRSEEKIEFVSVDALTPSCLIKELGYKKVDVIHLDVEGHEKKIFDAYPFNDFCPELIIFESCHLQNDDFEQVKEKLSKLDFRIRTKGMDTIAIRNDIKKGVADFF